MTTPTHNSPQVAHTTTEQAQLATHGEIPEGDLAELHRISLSPVWLKNRELVCILNHLPALLAAYEENQKLRLGYAEAVMAANSAAAKHAAKDNAIDMLAADVVREREARMQREQRIAELEAGLKRIKARSTRMVMCDWAAVDRMVDETLRGGAK